MTASYWTQWEKADLDDWQGKISNQCDDSEVMEDIEDLSEEEQARAQRWSDYPCCGGIGCAVCLIC